MEQVISFIHFDGHYWVAIVERIYPDSTVAVSKFVFGAEPGNADLLAFYLNAYQNLVFIRGDARLKYKKKRKMKDDLRYATKAREIYKSASAAQQLSKKKEKSASIRAEAIDRYRMRKEKKKDKKKGR